MSGGSFDYACYRFDSFADDLKNKIDENKTPDEYGYADNYSDDIVNKLKAIERLVRLAGKLAHEVEWMYSGDIGEETFDSRCKEHYGNYAKYLRDKWILRERNDED